MNDKQIPRQTQAQVELPNASAVLVLGILSLVLCGLIGLVLSIIALSMYKKAVAVYHESPEAYTKTSFSNLSTGKTCATIGVILSSVVLSLLLCWLLIYVFIIGAFVTGAASSTLF